jgi:hypothetical protein
MPEGVGKAAEMALAKAPDTAQFPVKRKARVTAEVR